MANCTFRSNASRNATVRSKILSNQGHSGLAPDYLDILFHTKAQYPGLNAMHALYVTSIVILGSLHSRETASNIGMKPNPGSRSEDQMSSSAVASFET